MITVSFTSQQVHRFLTDSCKTLFIINLFLRWQFNLSDENRCIT